MLNRGPGAARYWREPTRRPRAPSRRLHPFIGIGGIVLAPPVACGEWEEVVTTTYFVIEEEVAAGCLDEEPGDRER